MYIKQTWVDYPDTSSPLTAERLNHMEDGIEEAWNHGGGGGAGETLPIGSELDFDGQASDIPVGWEQVSGKSYVAYELWTNSNPTGSFSNVTLNIDTTNIDFIEVYYLRFATDRRMLCQKILNNSYKKSQLAYSDYDSGSVRSWNRNIDWNDTAFEFGKNYINGSVENNGLIPYKIVGYKEV